MIVKRIIIDYLHNERNENPRPPPEQVYPVELQPVNQYPNNYHQSANVRVALRTVPVVVKHNNKQLTINALLDDGSSKI